MTSKPQIPLSALSIQRAFARIYVDDRVRRQLQAGDLSASVSLGLNATEHQCVVDFVRENQDQLQKLREGTRQEANRPADRGLPGSLRTPWSERVALRLRNSLPGEQPRRRMGGRTN